MASGDFGRRLEAVLRRIEDALEDVDPAAVDFERGPDTLALLFRDGVRLVVSPQSAVEQIWVAAKDRGYHFRYDEPEGRWIEERGRCGELMELVRAEVREHGGVDVNL